MYRFSLLISCAVFVSQAATAAPCAGFIDVDDSSGFCVNVEWMKNRGITLGLTPTLYDPNSPVTRLQMAAFMYRLGFQNAFLQGGNAFGTTAVLGTTDDQAIEIRANNTRVMRYEHGIGSGGRPNVIGGSGFNTVGQQLNGVTIGGGFQNHATGGGNWGVVAGGSRNTTSAFGGAIGGGLNNDADGFASTVPGGSLNTASGDYSFAAGRRAKATQIGSFTWADSLDIDFGVAVPNFFAVRATGGVGFTVAIDPTNGGGTQYCDLSPGIVGWQCVSDRDAKENFQDVSGAGILAKLVQLPLFTYNFKGADTSIRNLGPTAQDFHASFGLSSSDKSIASGNLHGVALAAIQGLNAKLEAEVVSLRAELAGIRSLLSQR